MSRTPDILERARAELAASPQKPRIMHCRKHPNNRDNDPLFQPKAPEQLLLRASVLSPKGPGPHPLGQHGSGPRLPEADGLLPKRKKPAEYLDFEGFGYSHQSDRARLVDDRVRFYAASSTKLAPTAGYSSAANEAEMPSGLQLAESSISLRKKAPIDDSSLIGRHRRAAPTDQPFDSARHARAPRPSSCGLALGGSQASFVRDTVVQTHWATSEQPPPSLALSSAYSSARKPADPAKSINLQASGHNHLMLDSMTSSAIKKHLSLRSKHSDNPQDKKAELLEQICESKRDIDSLSHTVARLRAELQQLVPSADLATVNKLQARSAELQSDIDLLSHATELVQTENQANVERLRHFYEEKMQSANARTGDMSDCQDRLQENRLLKERLRQRKAEFEGRLQQKVESLQDRSRQQLELEEEYLFFKYETDPDAMRHDLLAYRSFLVERNHQLLAQTDSHSASLFSRLFS